MIPFEEELGIIAGMVEAAVQGDGGDGPVRRLQDLRAFFQPVGIEEAEGRHVGLRLEKAAALALANAGRGGDVGQAHRFLVMAMDIRDHLAQHPGFIRGALGPDHRAVPGNPQDRRHEGVQEADDLQFVKGILAAFLFVDRINEINGETVLGCIQF